MSNSMMEGRRMARKSQSEFGVVRIKLRINLRSAVSRAFLTVIEAGIVA